MAYFSPGQAGSASPASVRKGRVAAAAAFVFSLVLGNPAARADDTHQAEFKLFASTMAIARTATEECPGVSFDDRYLEGLRQRLHVVEADHPAFAEEAHAVVQVLRKDIAEAPSRQAWCDAVFRLYGSDGTLIRGMLRR